MKQLLVFTIMFTIIIGLVIKLETREPEIVIEYVYVYVTEYVDKPIEVLVEPTESIVKDDEYDGEDLHWLSRIISAEAKGESVNGQMAVGNVVMNRVNSDRYPNTIKEVVFQKGQFSPVNSGSIYNKPTEQAVESAKRVLDGESVVPSSTLFFYNPKIAKDSWIRGREVVMDIGNHRFAK